MKKRTKFLLSSLAALLSSLAFAGFAKASDISAENDTTGANSTNTSEVELNASKNIDINNNAYVSNQVRVSANTGNNSASKNTGNGSVKTGDAKVSASSSTDVNKVSLKGGSNGDLNISAKNKTTGANSENESEVEIDNSLDVDIENFANIVNDSCIDVNTGKNSADKNTGDGSVETGDASSSVSYDTKANRSFLKLGGSFGEINVDAKNEETGYGSENKAEAIIKDREKVEILNEAIITNYASQSSNSGMNSADKNTGDGSVKTGDAEANIEIENAVNEAVVKAMSEGSINVDLGNKTTGAESNNKAFFGYNEEDCKDNFVKIQNCASISNNANLYANTGLNSADCNTGDGSVETGDAKIDFKFNTKANKTEVNGFKAKDINVNVSNEQTGFNSDNEAEVEINDSSKTKIKNNASVQNQISANANTGQNSASKNTGDGSVKTGDAEVDGDISTKVNFVKVGAVDSGDIDVKASNSKTGACSENEAEVEIKSKEEVEVENEASIENCVEVAAETGCNVADENTKDGSVESGDIETDIEVASEANKTTSDGDESCDDNFKDDSKSSVKESLSGEGKISVKVNGSDVI